jgi:hypothetical protein
MKNEALCSSSVIMRSEEESPDEACGPNDEDYIKIKSVTDGAEGKDDSSYA